MPTCEVCNQRTCVGVCCVPGMPVSAAYCQQCLQANAHPWQYLVANAACCDGLANCAPWFVEMVDHTCTHLGKTREQFDADVKSSMEQVAAMPDDFCAEPEPPNLDLGEL